MKFNYFLIIFIFLLSGCGYQSIYKADKGEFFIVKFESNGPDEVTKSLVRNFKQFQNNKEAKKYYDVITSSEIRKLEKSKNTIGDIETYSLEVIVNAIIKKNNKIIKEKKFSENTTYKNINNKFELKQYENIIIKGQTNKIINKINIFLRSIQ